MHSWNRQPIVSHARVLDFVHRHDELPHDASLLAYGNGRSYGDVCLNENGTLLRTRRMERFIAFDKTTGRLKVESGILLKNILDLSVPQGWFLPVTPGTRFVSVGGAIANDVHGKNHHVAGTFGHHVKQFELLRSDGERKICSKDENAEWFYATIGGLGLTGMITWAELQLIPISNPMMVTQQTRFRNLDEFWRLNAASETQWPYTVAWIDCTATGRNQGRGILSLGQHAPAQMELPGWHEKSKTFPFMPPISLINYATLQAFNAIYYRRKLPVGNTLSHYVPYFYPLDGMLEWNRIYGRKGFYQYQCVIPPAASKEAIRDLLSIISRRGAGSFLAVLKTFGNIPSLGMLSFPRPGTTLALDFPNQGESTLRLLNELDTVTRQAGGALYPAKDARMSGEAFHSAYPLWEQFKTYIDPKFSSSFWRRVME